MSSLAGSFLIARPLLQDPNFARSVVLLLAHTPEGAYGVVVNRPLPAKDFPLPVLHGGPCESPGLLLLHGHPDWVEAAAGQGGQVAPGIFLGDAQTFQRAAHPTHVGAVRAKTYRGYAGWGPGQLEGELAAGAWAVTPAGDELLFDTPPEELWQALAPPNLPRPSLN